MIQFKQKLKIPSKHNKNQGKLKKNSIKNMGEHVEVATLQKIKVEHSIFVMNNVILEQEKIQRKGYRASLSENILIKTWIVRE